MNPDLLYAEMTPGKNNGSSTGIMDAHNIPDIIDAIGLIQHSPLWNKQDQQGMQLWFSKYLDWLLNSDFGKKEVQATNNHGTWYNVQTASKLGEANSMIRDKIYIIRAMQLELDRDYPDVKRLSDLYEN